MRVFVYWNLHRGMWSIKALEGPNKGRVIARRGRVLLSDVEGKVSEAGRQRVLREDRKNVHAGLVGRFEPYETAGDIIESFDDTITYNPRKYTSFVHTVDESKYEGSAYALLLPNRRVYVA